MTQRIRTATLGLGVMLAASLLLPAAGARADIDAERSDAQQATEKKTKVAFPRLLPVTEEVPELALTGAGVRTKFHFKVYACAHYVAKGTDLGPEPARRVIEGDFARRIVMHFVRGVGAKKIVDSFREGFEKNGYDPADPELAPDLEAFLAIFDRHIEDGEVIELTVLPGLGVRTDFAGKVVPPMGGERFIAGLWSIWFGDKPVSKGLREDLLELASDG